MKDLIVSLCFAVIVQLAILAQGQAYTNVIYMPSSSQSGKGNYGANNYIDRCTNIPENVRQRYSNCANGSPLAGLRIGGNLTEFNSRIAFGSIVGPTGILIANDPEQFYSGELIKTLAEAGLPCTRFYSFAQPNDASLLEWNEGCSVAFDDFLGSSSAFRFHRPGSCTLKTAGTWYNQAPVNCDTTVHALCVCSSLNTPTSSPTIPTSSPTKSPTVTPTGSPTRSPTPPTFAPSKAPTMSKPTRSPTLTPTTIPSKTPTFPTLSPTKRPTPGPAIVNVVYTVRTGTEPGEYNLQSYLNACANIPMSVKRNFPSCDIGMPLSSIQQNGDVNHFNSLMNMGKVVGPNGLVIANTVSQFYGAELSLTLANAEVGCGSRFFTATETSGLASTQACRSSSSADTLSSSSDDNKYRYGSCSVKTAGWFSRGQEDCDKDADFVCFCRVLFTDSPVPAPTVSPGTPETTAPSNQPSTALPTRSPTEAPTNRPTTLRPTGSPTHAQPTYSPTAYSVIYTAFSTAEFKDGMGTDRFVGRCTNIPAQVLATFPLCIGGAPFASLRQSGSTSNLVDIVKSGPVYGPAGALIAENPLQFYTKELNSSLRDAGVTCGSSNRFFSGTLPNGLANTGRSECATSETGEFMADDDEDLSFHYGSCTSTSSGWFSAGQRDCEDEPALLCYCRVLATSGPTVATEAPTNELGATDGSASNSNLEVTAAAAWGIVGVLAAVIVAAAVVVYVGKHKKRQTMNAMPTEQSTQLAMRTNADLE